MSTTTSTQRLIDAASEMLDAIAYSKAMASSDSLEDWASVSSRGEKAEAGLRAAVATMPAELTVEQRTAAITENKAITPPLSPTTQPSGERWSGKITHDWLYDIMRDKSGEAGEYVPNNHLDMLAGAVLKALMSKGKA